MAVELKVQWYDFESQAKHTHSLLRTGIGAIQPELSECGIHINDAAEVVLLQDMRLFAEGNYLLRGTLDKDNLELAI